jgi:hypothetical protein
MRKIAINLETQKRNASRSLPVNRYNMQTSSARGLQEEICKKEEKRLGTSVLP